MELEWLKLVLSEAEGSSLTEGVAVEVEVRVVMPVTVTISPPLTVPPLACISALSWLPSR